MYLKTFRGLQTKNKGVIFTIYEDPPLKSVKTSTPYTTTYQPQKLRPSGVSGNTYYIRGTKIIMVTKTKKNRLPRGKIVLFILQYK